MANTDFIVRNGLQVNGGTWVVNSTAFYYQGNQFANSTNFSGTANNALTANNASNLGGIAPSSYYKSGGTDVAVSDGGTGASDAAGARTNLGLGALATLSAVGAAELAAGSVTTAKIADANVTSAKLADGAIGTAKLGGDITAAGKALLDDADAAAQRTTLGAAPLASPALTGTPTAPTAAAYTNTTQVATTANVRETASTVPINFQITTSYTLTAADQGRLLLLENASPITLTVPADSSVNFPVGTRIDVVQWYGAGQITFSAAAGASIVSAGSKVKTASTYSGATLIKHAANGWLLIGDLA